MAQSVADTIRNTMSGQANAQRGMQGMIRDALGGLFGGSPGAGGGGSGTPPSDPAASSSPDDGDDGSGRRENDSSGLAGMLVGALAAMVPNPMNLFKPPPGSEAVIGRENANVARSMADAPGDLAKGFAVDLVSTPVFGGPIALGKAAMRATDMVDGWSKSLLSSMERLRMFSGTIAQAEVQARFRQFNRDIRSADATGGTTAKLSEAYEDLQDTFQPIKDDVRNILNRVTEFAVRAIDNSARTAQSGWEILKYTSKTANRIDQIWDYLSRKEGGEEQALQTQFLTRIRDGIKDHNGKQVGPKK